ncbi:MAG: hypothetical protein Q7S12_03725 [bacterium]|nr:hypothetical protein [bacterium]
MSNLDVLHVVLGLHWYQPHTQKRTVLKKIIENSYLPILAAIEDVCSGSIACDIAGSLILQLAEEAPEVIEKISALKKAGKITLVNTAAYHPILPLVPANFAENQLLVNENILRQCGLLSPEEKPSGVFPPEMAYDEKLLPILKKLGAKWVVTDDLPYNTVYKFPTPARWLAKREGIVCFLRSRLWSSEMSFKMPRGDDYADNLFNNFGTQFKKSVHQAYVVLWTDAETFGEHHSGAVEHFLKPFIRTKRASPILLVSPDDLLKLYGVYDTAIPAGSWSSGAEDIPNIPYGLWKNPKEEWHKLWWELADLSLKISDANQEASVFCDRALYSCQTWWWSLYKNKDLFLWAMPDFRKILEYGTSEQRKTGENLIFRLS